MNIILTVFLFYKLWIPAAWYHDLILVKGASQTNSTATNSTTTFYFMLILYSVTVFLFYKLWIPAAWYHDLILVKGASQTNSTATNSTTTFFFMLIPSRVLSLGVTSVHEQRKWIVPNNTGRSGFLFLRRPTGWCISWARGGGAGSLSTPYFWFKLLLLLETVV